MLDKSVKFAIKSVNNGFSNISTFIIAIEALNLLSSSGVILMVITDFISSSSVYYIFIFTKRKESLHSVVLEHMSIGKESVVGWHFLDLSESRHASVLP